MAELAKLLAPAFTVVYSYDRRGRGESTDTKPYSVQREVEDIEALLDSAGEAACLFGISSGGALALYDAAVLGEDRTVPVSRVSDITAHTLIMDGGQSYRSMPFMRTTAEVLTRAIPNAQHRVIEGHRHDIDIKVLAPVLTEFFRKENETTIDPVINS